MLVTRVLYLSSRSFCFCFFDCAFVLCVWYAVHSLSTPTSLVYFADNAIFPSQGFRCKFAKVPNLNCIRHAVTLLPPKIYLPIFHCLLVCLCVTLGSSCVVQYDSLCAQRLASRTISLLSVSFSSSFFVLMSGAGLLQCKLYLPHFFLHLWRAVVLVY